MEPTQTITRSILINAGVADVWDALTNPQKTKKFMFNCEARSTWLVGSSINWSGNFQGYESGEKGIILNFEKEKRLKYSSIDPNFGIADIPENYLHITYDLASKGAQTELTTIIDNFNNDPNRCTHIAKGWDTIVLPALKTLLENQPG
jgi:uncharacterized protein YndB with AHSA1/START domain